MPEHTWHRRKIVTPQITESKQECRIWTAILSIKQTKEKLEGKSETRYKVQKY